MNGVITAVALLVASAAGMKNMCRICQELEEITINTEDQAMATMMKTMMESMLGGEEEDSPFVMCSTAEMQPCDTNTPDCLSFRIMGEQMIPNPNNANGDSISMTMEMDMAMCGIADVMTCDMMEQSLGDMMAGVEDVTCEADVDVWAEKGSNGNGNSGDGNSGDGNSADGNGVKVGEKCRPCMEIAIDTEDEAVKTMYEAMMSGAGGEDSPFVKCSAAEESDCSSALPDCVSIQMSGDQSIPNPSGSGDNIELVMKFNMAMCGVADVMTCDMMEQSQGPAMMAGVSNLKCKTGVDVWSEADDGSSSSTSTTASITLLLSVLAYFAM